MNFNNVLLNKKGLGDFELILDFQVVLAYVILGCFVNLDPYYEPLYFVVHDLCAYQ